MKAKIFLIVSVLSALFFSACKKHNFAEGQLSPIIALVDLRAIHKGADVTLSKDNMLGAYQITGKVISMPDSGNVPQGVLILQNNRRKAIRGIQIPLGEAAGTFKSGDSIVVNIEGTTLKRVNGALQLTGVTQANITTVSTGNEVQVQQVSSYSIKTKPDEYESTLVSIKSATVSPAPVMGQTKYVGNKYLVNGADSIIMHTEPTAQFADEFLPAGATVAGILIVDNSVDSASVYQVWPRKFADISDITKPADPNAPDLGEMPVVITGFVNDAKGSDGNYEYIQFRATQNIDFSVTPMAVVTCTNAGAAQPNAGDAPGASWATGGGRTYKFNLTNGQVKKGDFFYVGGSNKRVNGPNTTDISDAKWISSIAYVTNDGDGFGSASSGLLPNSGNAGGIAIFKGINVTEQTVPVDVVFFGGTGKTTMYNPTTNKGYRVPKTDHYNFVDETGAEQPFFYQGTNQYVIPHVTPADQGVFMKLGGDFDAETKTWITPRGISIFIMSGSTALTEIETGSDVTAISN
ncbi:DUF5689 domain-containing protein [Mucilaginibacter roseus]|uniref:DUF5689 domain-containing protein n=1 Tax=Mucilaginibacter roseus TaxID=1528868 RepID=A0ABS8U7U1_9SPHI|nr:DUF5689 domain-containing protein [Mucilaginibacter roseus]MCD8741992.1 DUF5689 domain-containing protein [Mucilaginibacter roseus]